MRSPDFSNTAEAVSGLVHELGEHEYAGIVSVGPVGVGKSSNLNTVASYLSNRLEQEAGCGAGTGSMTHENQTHIISYQGRPVKWKWMDTPGDLFAALVEDWKRTRLLPEEAAALPMADYEARLEELLLQPMASQQLGCVMAMVSAPELAANTSLRDAGGAQALSVSEGSRLQYHLQVLKDLYPRLVRRSLRMIVVLTKTDLVDAAVDADVTAITTSEAVHLLRTCVSRECGVPLNQVHAVVNLVKDFDPMDNLPLGLLALFNVRAALAAARHADTVPQHPRRMSGATLPWDTLTVPSSITSDDGASGRSFPVDHLPMSGGGFGFGGGGRESGERGPQGPPDDARSTLTDIDDELIREG